MMRPTLARVRAALARSNGGLRARVVWADPPRLVTYPTGLQGYTATVVVTAAGYRPTIMRVSADADSLMVR